MNRYCIACEEIFGCIKGSVKYDCFDCHDVDSCTLRNDYTKTHLTSGICEDCWEKRHLIKMAAKTTHIAQRVDLGTAHNETVLFP